MAFKSIGQSRQLKNSRSKNPQQENIFFQPKLTIGQPGDKFEKEADAMADQVMRMPQKDNSIQRKCQDCEEESLQMKPLGASIIPMVQRKTSVEEKETVQMKLDRDKESSTSNLSDQLNQSKGKGYNLSDSTNGFMNNSFGTDFSGVKIHTDSNAVHMNQSLGARAFTHGNDVYFNKGEYNPSTEGGKHLLAHELTHVVQQGGSKNNSLNKKSISNTDTYIAKSPLECENERGGNLWFDTESKAINRRKNLIKVGECTLSTCHIRGFDNPLEKGKKAFRVVICKEGETKDNGSKDEKKSDVESPKKTSDKKGVIYIKIYLSGIQKIEVVKDGVVMFSEITSVGIPIKKFLSSKKADGIEGGWEYREYKTGGKQKVSGKGLRYFVNVDGKGYGVHSQIQEGKKKVLNADGNWDPTGLGCARLQDDKAKDFFDIVGPSPMIRYYQKTTAQKPRSKPTK